METERDCHHHREQWLSDRVAWRWIFKPAEERAGRGQPPACPPARASVMLSASAKLKDTWCHVLFTVGAWRLSVTVRASVLCGLNQTGLNVPTPCKQSQCVRVVCKTLVLKAPCPLQLWVDNSWRRVVGLCSLSPYTPPPRPTSSSSMFPWNRPVIFTAVSPAVCRGESRKQRLRQREAETGAG